MDMDLNLNVRGMRGKGFCSQMKFDFPKNGSKLSVEEAAIKALLFVKNMNKNFPQMRAWYTLDALPENGGEYLKFIPAIIEDDLYWAMEQDREIAYPFSHCFLDDNWIINKSTGLTDENGREIYEDDIIKLACVTNTVHDKLTFKVVLGRHQCSFGEGYEHEIEYGFHGESIEVPYFFLPLLENPVEVIGNIYENPKAI